MPVVDFGKQVSNNRRHATCLRLKISGLNASRCCSFGRKGILTVVANFFDRFHKYVEDVAQNLRNGHDQSKVFSNASDLGQAREDIYINFLKQNLYPGCDVFPGGYLFDMDGTESKQIDIIVTSHMAPRFRVSGVQQAFAPVDGTLAAISIKSTLGRRELYDALTNISSIPSLMNLSGRVNPALNIKNHEDWPCKVVFAYKGDSLDRIAALVNQFYTQNPSIPLSRRPNIIHVLGNFLLAKGDGQVCSTEPTGESTRAELGEYVGVRESADVSALIFVLECIQRYSWAMNHIVTPYHELLNRVVTSGIASGKPG